MKHHVNPVEPGVLTIIEQSFTGFREKNTVETDIETNKLIEVLEKFNIISVLHHVMVKFTATSFGLMENMMAIIEDSIGSQAQNLNKSITLGKAANTFKTIQDTERDNHILSVFSRLLFSFDGLNEEKTNTYIERLQGIAKSCTEM
jgi:hypothetical protein